MSQIGPKWDNSGDFSSDLKNPWICLTAFCADLTDSGPKSETPVTCGDVSDETGHPARQSADKGSRSPGQAGVGERDEVGDAGADVPHQASRVTQDL